MTPQFFEPGILILTQKGQAALKNTPLDLSPVCRNILVQVDDKKSAEDIRLMFRGLRGLEEALQRLLTGNFIQVSRECRDLIKPLARQMLGSKAPTLLNKIDELHARYGDTWRDHIDDVYRTARLFYGEVVADSLRTEICNIHGITPALSAGAVSRSRLREGEHE